MILTGKAKEDFEKWLTKGMSVFTSNMKIVFFNQKLDVEKNAIIVDWFDSVGIHIGIQYFEINSVGTYDWRVHYNNSYGSSKTRQEAIKQSIIKANEIYNKSN